MSPTMALVTGMGFEPIISALRTQRLNRLTNRPCGHYYNTKSFGFQVFYEIFFFYTECPLPAAQDPLFSSLFFS